LYVYLHQIYELLPNKCNLCSQTCYYFGKASGSKLKKKNKTKRLWIRAWNDRKDNYRFGIDFVEYIQIVGFKIGNNVTQDDICHPIYVKFENKSVKLMEI
jgi:hypothetical protein